MTALFDILYRFLMKMGQIESKPRSLLDSKPMGSIELTWLNVKTYKIYHTLERKLLNQSLFLTEIVGEIIRLKLEPLVVDQILANRILAWRVVCFIILFRKT